jgi:hypothetical protein
MLIKASSSLLVAVAALGLSLTPVKAVIVYNGGAPNQVGTFFAGSPIIEAMSFSLAAGSNTVSGVNFWGGCSDGGTCGTANIALNFYNSVGGAPGSLIDSINVGQANQTLTGLNISPTDSPFAEYSYTATFASQTFTAGVTYFIGITNSGTGPFWGVENTSSLASVDYQSFDGGTTWGLTAGQNAFELTASVPEASTWAMMIVGFLSLGMVGMRRRSVVGFQSA